MDYGSILLIVAALCFFLILVWCRTSYVYVLSKIDGKTYIVKNNSLSQESADALATINQKILKLKTYITTMDPKPGYAGRLNNYKYSENILNIDTSFTINKKYVYMCLTPKDNTYVYDINTLMYIALHEFAHVCSKSSGHTREFMKIYKDLLKHAIDIGIYEYIDYRENPINYCGLAINMNMADLSGWS